MHDLIEADIQYYCRHYNQQKAEMLQVKKQLSRNEAKFAFRRLRKKLFIKSAAANAARAQYEGEFDPEANE